MRCPHRYYNAEVFNSWKRVGLRSFGDGKARGSTKQRGIWAPLHQNCLSWTCIGSHQTRPEEGELGTRHAGTGHPS